MATTFSTVEVGPRAAVNPVLIDLPERIETERLIVRPPRFGDGPAVNAAIRESIAELRPWMPWAQTEPTVEQTEENMRRAVAKFAAREDLRLQFHLKDGTFVGSSGLHRINWDVPKFEIGYWVRTSCAGRGYVTEAVAAIARLAFETLRAARVEIRCDEQNVRSRRVAERLGFAQEGTLRNQERDPRGELRNTVVYSKIAMAGVT